MQAVSQFDVLDGGPLEAFVKTAVLEKHAFADGAAAAPESGRLAARGLVDEAVHQVLVERDKVLRRGSVVVGTDQGVQLRIGFERIQNVPKCIRMNANVGID